MNNYSHTSKDENDPSSSHTFTGNNSNFKLTKTKHNGKSKTRVISEIPTSIKPDFYIGVCVQRLDCYNLFIGAI